MLLQEVMEGCELSAVLQGILASGPAYTYCSGEVRTTVDYILMDVEATSMITSCRTHDMTDLNTLDHLPVTASLVYNPVSVQENHNAYVSTLSRID